MDNLHRCGGYAVSQPPPRPLLCLVAVTTADSLAKNTCLTLCSFSGIMTAIARGRYIGGRTYKGLALALAGDHTEGPSLFSSSLWGQLGFVIVQCCRWQSHLPHPGGHLRISLKIFLYTILSYGLFSGEPNLQQGCFARLAWGKVSFDDLSTGF